MKKDVALPIFCLVTFYKKIKQMAVVVGHNSVCKLQYHGLQKLPKIAIKLKSGVCKICVCKITINSSATDALLQIF